MRRWCCSRKRRNGKLWRALAGMTLDERVALAESGFRPTRYADLTAMTLVGLVGRLVDRRPGQPHRTRARLDTGMHVYDAELLRVRAHTYTNLDAAPPAFTPPANWPAARAPSCSNCVPPSVISSHAASPPVPHSLTLSASSPPTTYCRNWRSPARYWFHPDRRAGSHPGRRHGLRRIETVVPEGLNRPRESETATQIAVCWPGRRPRPARHVPPRRRRGRPSEGPGPRTAARGDRPAAGAPRRVVGQGARRAPRQLEGHARRYLEFFVEVGMVVRSLRYGGGGRPEVEYRCEYTEGDADPVTPPR